MLVNFKTKTHFYFFAFGFALYVEIVMVHDTHVGLFM